MTTILRAQKSVFRTLLACSLLLAACSSDDSSSGAAGGSGGSGGSSSNGGSSGSSGSSGSGGLNFAPQLGSDNDPPTCEQAANAHSYIGCEFWPTVTLNPVWSVFDFAIVVANVGPVATTVTVDLGGKQVATTTVAPLDLAKIYLPWVPELKGPDTNECGQTSDVTESVAAEKGAYRVITSNPVIVYQYNALEFRGAGGPAGKNWSTCPGYDNCVPEMGVPGPIGCFSFSNDASLLLPKAAMTGNYRVTTLPIGNNQGFVAITGTEDNTKVAVKLSDTAEILKGGPVEAAMPGDILNFTVNAGDVVQLVSASASADLSGSIVQANHPIQVIAGSSCAAIPSVVSLNVPGTCDHLEESLLPVETLGKHYFITAPTGPLGTEVAHSVRIHGNVNGTKLSYPQGAPDGAPESINAGETIELKKVTEAFEILSDQALAVSMYLLSAAISDPDDIVSRGDPSQSSAISVDQYRSSYVFLAPDDYDVSFLDVITPMDAEITLDDAPLPATPVPIGSSGFGVARVRLGTGENGAHSLKANRSIGIQVLGYGSYTSYQVPGGLNLQPISPPLDPIE